MSDNDPRRVGQVVTFGSEATGWRRQLEIAGFTENGDPVYKPVESTDG